MGWTYTHREGQSAKEFFGKEFTGNGRVLDVAATLKEAYIAYELLDRGTGVSKGVIAFVCLTNWVRDDYYNFGYKDMEESDGPYVANCPQRILDLLTPVEKLYADGVYTARSAVRARQWRRACLKRLAEKAAAPKVTPGMVLSFDPPVRLLDREYATLRCTNAKRLYFSDNLTAPLEYVRPIVRLLRETMRTAKAVSA